MNILGIETSCDETAAAVVRDGRDVLSSAVFSQVKLHAPYGGVVPEIASRSHVEVLPGVMEQAVEQAGLGWEEIDGVAATYGPGLASSLLVGLSAGKGLSMRLKRPLYGMNHLEAHVYSAFLGTGIDAYAASCPFIALVVSGGHTCLVRVKRLGEYELLGQTLDDAAGEAFDKGATLLDLGYPGGPAMQKAAEGGQKDFVRFPRGRPKKASVFLGSLDPALCFSFSGLKTSLLYYLKEHPASENKDSTSSVAASYQEAIVDALVERCDRAVKGERCLLAGGGVTLNKRLRDRLAQLAEKRGIQSLLAEPKYCGDNAAMIAGLAGAGQGVTGDAAMALDAEPNLVIG